MELIGAGAPLGSDGISPLQLTLDHRNHRIGYDTSVFAEPPGWGCSSTTSGQHFLSQALNSEYIGLEEVQDGLWNLLYYDTLLGRFNEHTHTITGAPSLKGK